MPEETNQGAKAQDGTVRAAVVEFDSTAFDGASAVFEAAKKALARSGVELTRRLEAKWLLNRTVQVGVQALFQSEGKSGAAQAAQEVESAAAGAVASAAASAATDGLREFAAALAAKGVLVVVVTRADPETVRAALPGLGDSQLKVVRDEAGSYGSLRREGWAAVCEKAGLRPPLSVAVTGSGFGVRGALQAGLCALAIPNPSTEWQDFGGADGEARSLGREAAAEVLRILHLS